MEERSKNFVGNGEENWYLEMSGGVDEEDGVHIMERVKESREVGKKKKVVWGCSCLPNVGNNASRGGRATITTKMT